MSERQKQRLLDLLSDQILFGLDETEQTELTELKKLYSDISAESMELTASAIALTVLREIEPLPEKLQTKILQNADNFFAADKKNLGEKPFKVSEATNDTQKTFAFEPRKNWTNWLGWAFAAVACLALAFSLLNRPQPVEIVKEVPPKVLSVAEQYDNLMASAKDLKRTNWTNPKNPQEILGEIVWSDSLQKGFMKFKGLPVNEVAKEQYQLWIFDETQPEKTPIDGGVFNSSSNGETIVPINAKLMVKNPKLFAVTVEKPGGVVVSKREKIVAVGKI